MNRYHGERFRLITLVLLLVFWLPFYGGYLAYDGLVEADFLSPTLIFENPDQDGLFLDHQNKAKLLPASTDLNRILEGSGFPEPVLIFSMPDSPSPLSISLRC